MEGSVIAGMGAASFWFFLAAIVVAGVWSNVREREAKQATIRDLLAKSATLDEATVDKLVAVIESDKRRDAASTREGLVIAYKIMVPVAAGLVILGLMVGALLPMIGVAGLVLCVAYGLLMASRTIKVDDEPPRT